MTKFERVLIDDQTILDMAADCELCFEDEDIESDLILFAKAIKQAVLAKLAEQEPVMFARTYNGEIDWDEDCVTEDDDGLLLDGLTHVNDDGDFEVEEGYAAIPLYAHPCVTPVSVKQACDSQNEMYETQIPDGTLTDEGTKGHHKATESHIPDAGKMIEHESHSLEFEVRTMVEMLEAKEWADHSGQSALGKRLEVVISTLHNELYEAQAKRSKPELAKNQPCGCVVCYCENQDQCQGCGAKSCGTHEVGEIPNPIYADHIPDAGKMIEPEDTGQQRDEIALAALTGLLGNSGGAVQHSPMSGWALINCTHEEVAQFVYRMADAMLKERKK